MTDTDKRCGTCRFFAPPPPHVEFGYCAWWFQQDLPALPNWVARSREVPLTHRECTDCDAWEGR